MLLGGALILGSMLLLATTSLPTYLVAMALFGCGSAFVGVSTAAVVGDVIGGRGGTPVAAYQMSSDAGTFIGPLVAGFLSDRYSFTAAFLASAGVSAVGLAAVASAPETRHVLDREEAPPAIAPEP